jgi:hypothetical protein
MPQNELLRHIPFGRIKTGAAKLSRHFSVDETLDLHIICAAVCTTHNASIATSLALPFAAFKLHVNPMLCVYIQSSHSELRNLIRMRSSW